MNRYIRNNRVKCVYTCIERGKRKKELYNNTHILTYKYNSEDNSSFTEILDRTNAKRREKYKWLLDKEKAPMLTHEEKKMIEHATSPATWKYTARNALMYIPNGTGESLLNEADSRAPAKAINYTNTQFKVPEVKKDISSLLVLLHCASMGGKNYHFEVVKSVFISHTIKFIYSYLTHDETTVPTNQ